MCEIIVQRFRGYCQVCGSPIYQKFHRKTCSSDCAPIYYRRLQREHNARRLDKSHRTPEQNAQKRATARERVRRGRIALKALEELGIEV